MENAKEMEYPGDSNIKLDVPNKQDGELNEKDQLTYSLIIGLLLYLSNGTRPDIAYVVSTLSRRISKPLQCHMTAAKR